MHDDLVLQEFARQKRNLYLIYTLVLLVFLAALIIEERFIYVAFPIFGIGIMWSIHFDRLHRIRRGKFGNKRYERMEFEEWLKKKSGTPIPNLHLPG